MKLFVIGNGFDISHNIPCRYSDFCDYYNKNRSDVLEIIEKFYCSK
ncbi:AbiH family protein [Flavobacterium sp. '19STA2R22 D10 B1']